MARPEVPDVDEHGIGEFLANVTFLRFDGGADDSGVKDAGTIDTGRRTETEELVEAEGNPDRHFAFGSRAAIKIVTRKSQGGYGCRVIIQISNIYVHIVVFC